MRGRQNIKITIGESEVTVRKLCLVKVEKMMSVVNCKTFARHPLDHHPLVTPFDTQRKKVPDQKEQNDKIGTSTYIFLIVHFQSTDSVICTSASVI